MEKSLGTRLEHAWNAFRGKDFEIEPRLPIGGEASYGASPQRSRISAHSHKRVIAPIITQIAVDAAGVEMRHIMTGDNGEYEDDVQSDFSYTLLVSPNLDQGPSQFRQDTVATLLEEGVVCIVPVETTSNPSGDGGYDIRQLRTGIIKQWWARDVRVELYDENKGIRREIILPKESVGIVENPLYSIMNEPNSTLQRLMTKLNQLDVTDDRLASGKLDIILQLPYTIKHESRLREAKKRVGAIEDQLVNSRHGIGYIDSTERITQLNRPSENNLLEQVTSLETRLYSQLGLTDEIFFGTADEPAMLNYQNRTLIPIVRAIQEEMKRKFFTKNAITRGHSIKYFRDPFTLVPVSQIAEIADKFTRNEIMAPNEIRPIVGLKPVNDPKADELRNRNMPEVLPEDEKEKEEVEEDPKEELDPKKPVRRTLASRKENENDKEEA